MKKTGSGLMLGLALLTTCCCLAEAGTIQLPADGDAWTEDIAGWTTNVYNGGCNPVCSLFSETRNKKEGNASIGIKFLFPGKDTNKCSYVRSVVRKFDPSVDISRFDVMKGWLFNSSSEIPSVSLYLFDSKGACRNYSCKSKPECWTEFSLPLDQDNRPIKKEEIKRIELIVYSSDKIADGKERHILLDGFRFEKTQLSFGEIRSAKEETGRRIEMPRKVFAPKLDQPPRLDDKANESCWKNKCENGFLTADTSKMLNKDSALSLGYDDKNFYIRVECREPDSAKIKKDKKERDGSLWENDCVEVFLMPRTNEYFHFIVDAANEQFDQKSTLASMAGGFNKDKGWNGDWKSTVRIEPGQWVAELAIPFKDLGMPPPAEGEVWKGNFCREEKELGENSSYFPTCGWFHDTSTFGDIVFGNFAQTLKSDMSGLEKKISEAQEAIAKYNNPELISRLGKAKENIQGMKAALPGKITEESEYKKIKGEILKADDEIKDIVFDYYALKDGYLVWRKNPLASLGRDRIPLNVKEDVREINMVMGRNEIEMCSLVIANFKEKALAGRVVVSRFRDKKGNLLAPDFIGLKETAFIELKGGKFVDDPLPALNEVNEIVALPRENKEVILFVDSWKLQPGEYSGIVDIRPYEGTNSFPVKTVKLNISVLPVDLKNDHLSLMVYELDNWIPEPGKQRERKLRMDEFEISRELWPEYVRDLVKHRVNVFHPPSGSVPCPLFEGKEGGYLRKIREPLDQSKLPLFDYELEQYRKHWKEGTILNVCPVYLPCLQNDMKAKDIKRFTPEIKDNLAMYFKALIGHLKAQGFSEDDFVLYMYDEVNATPEYVDNFCETVKIIEGVNPKVRVFLTLSPGTKLEDTIKKVAPYVGIWCPYMSYLNTEYLEFFKSTKKTIWSYANFGYSGQKGSPLNIEKYGWLAWARGIQGIGSWAYNYWIADGWDDFDNLSADPVQGKRSAEAYVYWGPKGPVTSRRWEAMREAMEDHELLFCLKNAILEAQDKKTADAQPRQILEQAPGAVLSSEDADIICDYKAKILKEITRLRQ